MEYLRRYTGGQHEQVWAELQALGEAVRQEPVFAEARLIAEETMRRVRRNCERIVGRLGSMGYQFGVYPDGGRGYYTLGPLVPADAALRGDMQVLEEAAGPLPVSLAAFWEQVGSVDLVGRQPGWPTGLDPLGVNPPAAAVSELDEREF